MSAVGLELDLALYDRDPVAAIQEFWLDLAENDHDLSADELAEAVIDGRVARGDYEGCSTEMEIDYSEAVGWYARALAAEDRQRVWRGRMSR